MARHKHHKAAAHHRRHSIRSYMGHNPRRHNPYHHHRRHNPFGMSASVVSDSAYNAAGALGAMFLSNMAKQTGWMDVAATGAVAVGLGFVGKSMGAGAGEELLKGGLTATIIKALHQAGFAANLGLGSYAPSWFGVPTASSQYMRAFSANMGPASRGQGTILVSTGNGSLLPATIVPGPNGTPTAVPVAALPGGVSPAPTHGTGMGYHRFRSRYAGNY